MGCPDPDETENEDPKLMGTLDEGTTIICPIYIVNISSMNPLPHLSMKGTPIIPSTDRNFNNTLFDPLSKFSTPPFHYFMYYNLPAYYKREMEKEMKNGFKKVQATERTIFNDEEQHILFFGKFPLTTTNLQLIKKTKDNFQVNLLDMKVNLYLSLMTGASIMESGSVRAPLDEELILKE
ncbi:hypothetical protein GmHk_17G049437 [Glycine max]|nr:hypothetical protein GmHk_17G049437 [Glycine max]